jgi:hypothetical protein
MLKPKISYNTIKNNKTLEGFIEDKEKKQGGKENAKKK